MNDSLQPAPAAHPRGLRFKLAVALASVAVLTAASSGFLTMRAAYSALKTQKQQDELVIARNIAAQVGEVLVNARRTVESLALNPALRFPDSAAAEKTLTLVASVTELLDGAVILDLGGRVLAMDRADPDTRRLLPADPRSLVTPVLHSSGTFLSPVYRSQTGDPAFAICTPILRDGKIVAVLAGGMLPNGHSMGGIDGIRVGKSGYAYIVDQDGNAIVHPQRERLFENLSANPPVQELLKRKEGVASFLNKEGVDVLAAFSPITETGWGVVVRQPTSESYALADKLRMFHSMVLLGALAAALALAAFLSHQIAGPVIALVRGVREVASGKLDTNIPLAGTDEIAELADAFNDMTRQLSKRTEEAEAAQRRLLEAQAGLARSERLAAVGQLAAGLAHEINNPLNVISGFADFVRDKTPPGDPRRPPLEDISRETARCQRLVSQLLDLAHPKPTRPAPTSLNDLILETAPLLTAQSEPRGLKIETELDERLGLIMLDRDQMTQVLMNLILNACQASPSGGSVLVRSQAEAGGAAFTVRDQGEGIAPENLDRIFNPFFSTKEGGHGLGLALSHAIVERHEGSISVSSNPGEGTTFTVRLPAPRALP